jgi:aspartate-semialdehyde dehydrogenase
MDATHAALDADPKVRRSAVAVRLAILGATGLVGRMIRQVLHERAFPCDSIRMLASERSSGQSVAYGGKEYPVEPATAGAFRGVDIVLSSIPASVSRTLTPIAVGAGAVVIDNSSAFRMDPSVPLVVPEVNVDQIARHQGIISNPNCSTIQMVVALKPLHDLGRIRRIIVCTYQASSGKGGRALAEFEAQLAAFGLGMPIPAACVHKHQLLDNCLPDDWPISDDGYSEEENKMMRETRKIMGDDSISISATCVRVPVRTAHSEAINLEFERPVTVEAARAALSRAPGVVLLDDPAKGVVPTAQFAAGRNQTFVGRLRRDPSTRNGLNLWVVADNLRKGAATNAIQIAEHLLKLEPASV